LRRLKIRLLCAQWQQAVEQVREEGEIGKRAIENQCARLCG